MRTRVAVVGCAFLAGCWVPNPHLKPSETETEGESDTAVEMDDVGSEESSGTEATTESDSSESESDSSESESDSSESESSSETSDDTDSETGDGGGCPWEDVGVRRELVEIDCGQVPCRGRWECSEDWSVLFPTDEVVGAPEDPGLFGLYDCLPGFEYDYCVDPPFVSFSLCFWVYGDNAVAVEPLCYVDEMGVSYVPIGNQMAARVAP